MSAEKIWNDSVAGQIYYNGGRVGIGTASPVYKLDVNGSVRAKTTSYFDSVVYLGNDLKIQDKTGASIISLAPKSGSNFSSIRMLSTPENSTKNQWNWTVYGSLYPTTSVRNDLRLSYTDYLSPGPNRTEYVMHISNTNGYVHLGGTSDPTYRLQLKDDATGNEGKAIAHAWATHSDGRFKTDLQPITGALEKIKSLEGITYRSTTGTHPEKNAREVGFIAQDVRKVLPEVVTVSAQTSVVKGEEVTTPDYHAVSYDRMTALLVEGVKELDTKVEALRDPGKHTTGAMSERAPHLGVPGWMKAVLAALSVLTCGLLAAVILLFRKLRVVAAN